MHSMLLLLLAPLALSAPSGPFRRQTPYANTTSTGTQLPGLLYIDGEPIYVDGNPVGVESMANKLCDPLEDDVLTCALNKRARLLDPDDRGRSNIVAELAPAADGSYLKLDYGAFLSSCVVGQPQMMSKDPLKICSIDTCSEEFTWSEVKTSTTKYGIKIGSSQKATADPKLFKIEISLSEEFNAEWTDQTQTSITKKDTRILKRGDMCAWTAYQMFIDCDSSVDVGKFTVYTAAGQQKFTSMNNVCIQYTTDASRGSFIRGQGFSEDVVTTINKVCHDVLTTPTGAALFDYTEGSNQGTAWSIQGCMYE